LRDHTAGVLLHSQIRPESLNCGPIWLCLTDMRGVREERFRDGYTVSSLEVTGFYLAGLIGTKFHSPCTRRGSAHRRMRRPQILRHDTTEVRSPRSLGGPREFSGQLQRGWHVATQAKSQPAMCSFKLNGCTRCRFNKDLRLRGGLTHGQRGGAGSRGARVWAIFGRGSPRRAGGGSPRRRKARRRARWSSTVTAPIPAPPHS
jgi:hypothetical protein